MNEPVTPNETPVFPPEYQAAADQMAAADAAVAKAIATPAPVIGKGEPAPAAPEAPKSSSFAALSRKKRAVEARMKALEDKQAAVAQAELLMQQAAKAQAEKVAAYDRFQSMVKEGRTLEAMELAGLDYDTVIKQKLAGGPSPVDVAKLEIARFKAEFAKEQAAANEQMVKQRQVEDLKRQKAQAVANIKTMAAAAADKYELVNAQDASELVLDTMEAAYKLTGEVPSYEEALTATESHLEETLKGILAKSKKFGGAVPASSASTVATPGASTSAPADAGGLVARLQSARSLGPANVKTLIPGAARSNTPVEAPTESRDAFIKRVITQTLSSKGT